MASAEDGGEGPQKDFRITPEGQRELDAWLRTPSAGEPPPRAELVIKILVAMQVPGVDVAAVVQAHRRNLVELMQRYTQVKAEAGEHDLGLSLVVDAELFRLEGLVRWLDTADVRLRRHEADWAANPTGTPTAPDQALERR